MKKFLSKRLPFLLILSILITLIISLQGAPTAQANTLTYTNPLFIQIPGDGRVTSCADPSLIHSQTHGDPYWYMYCTKDPLNGHDKNGSGDFNFHNIPMLKSLDLVHWTYIGDAFSAVPSWGEPNAGMFAPDIEYMNGQYYLYYTITNTKPGFGDLDPNCPNDNAIGVATSSSPAGPWTDVGYPVVYPRANGGGCNYFWTFDPEVVEDGGLKYIFYGSYYGGIQARQLDPTGTISNPGTEVQITIPNRYEGAELVKHNGYWYLFVSAANCCNGPLTGYSVFAGRSANLLGPYVDKQGVSFLDSRVGGTVVLSMNGNRWVGPGHNSVFVDFGGQWWTIYHAVNRFEPYFDDALGFTRRPVLMDPLDWLHGWPTVRGGYWASDTLMPAPAAQPGDTSAYTLKIAPPDVLGDKIPALSDEFNGTSLSPQWTWVRQPAPGTYGEGGGTFRFDTQDADLYVNSNNASVLTEPTPHGDYVVETKVKLNVPPSGCCFNYRQAGLVIYKDDDQFIKLVHFSLWETRQTEFAKEIAVAPDPGNPNSRYGNTVVGPPGDWTWLRIVKRSSTTEELYRAYTSNDGVNWERGGVWTHNLGASARIGLVSMGGSGSTANFDYVRVYHLR